MKVLDKLKHIQYEDIAQFVIYKKLKVNDIIYKQGDLADGFYFILSGCVHVYTHINIDKDFQIQELQNELHAGESFGEAALIEDNALRSTTVVCEDNTECLFLGKQIYDQCVQGKANKDFTRLINIFEEFGIIHSYNQDVFQSIRKTYYRNNSKDFHRGTSFLSSSLFNQFNQPKMELAFVDIVHHSRFKKFYSNTVIEKQNGTCKKVYFILCGRLQVMRHINIKKPLLVEICQISDGQIFGMDEALSQENYKADLISIYPVELLTIQTKDLLRLDKKILQRCYNKSVHYPTDEDLHEKFTQGVQWQEYKKTLTGSIFNNKQITPLRHVSNKFFETISPLHKKKFKVTIRKRKFASSIST